MNIEYLPLIDPKRWQRLKGHLNDLADLDPAARMKAAHGLALDIEDRQWLEKLLAQLDPQDARLRSPLRAAPMAYTDTLRWQAGETVGAYCVDGLLGRGGMSEVYAAHVIATGQAVALKTLRHGLEQQGFGHFSVNEQRALQRLNDPYIARFIEAFHVAEMGPCLVLERVEGEPLDLWCQRNNPSADARLVLFEQICHAIASAHQQLVVHRDLKPGNVFVTAVGSVKLLDFGVAKLLDDTESATQTHGGLFTLEFAAPEQILRQPVSAATDVYALGVLLFHLLTDASPYVVAAHESLVKAVLSDRPRRLSSVKSKLGNGGVVFDHDLDRVIARAMEKDPRDRYRSATEMAADVQAIRDGVPILAGGGKIYRMAKFLRRHPAGVAMTVVVALTLIAATIASLYWAQRADLQAQKASMLAHRAQAANRFLITVLDVSDRFSERNRGDLTLAQVLNRAVELAGTELADEPETRADVLSRLSNVLQRRGELKRALSAANAAHASLAARPDHDPALLVLVLQRLASIEIDLRQLDAANQHLSESLRLLESIEGDQTALKLTLMSSRGRVANARGNPLEALRIYTAMSPLRTTLKGDQRADTAMDFHNASTALNALSRFNESNVAEERAIALLGERVDLHHSRFIVLRSGHAASLINLGRFHEARAELMRADELLGTATDSTDPTPYRALIALQFVTIEYWSGDYLAARDQLDALGADVPTQYLPSVLILRGRVAFALGDGNAAAAYFEQAEQHYLASGASNHPRRWLAHGLAAMARAAGSPAESAETAYAEAIGALADAPMRDSAERAELLLVSGVDARRHGDQVLALGLHRQCDEVVRRNGWLGELGRAWIEGELAQDFLAQSVDDHSRAADVAQLDRSIEVLQRLSPGSVVLREMLAARNLLGTASSR